MKKSFRLLIFIMFGILAASSCEKSGPECYQPISILAKNRFKVRQVLQIDSTTDSTVVDTTIITYNDTALAAPAMYSIDMNNNIAIFGAEGATHIDVPFNPSLNSIRYLFQYDTAIAQFDTITYYYTSTIHFISNECGFTNYYSIDSINVTQNFIDSFALIKKEVTASGSDIQVLFFFF